ncbi:hypothetical protein NYQ10_21640 [Flavobacterium johnsoniae]|uniref:hypothetical protein n=1 Tax=Flavobacterium johnsoniae TaxID=986 RepID=UPI0025B27845|nr:hypothetical protein [Flavobacterium johnsoniae]WJS94687.1 hypothetical protein NYQ10_21640 [Flavobacterium johnsoniae]
MKILDFFRTRENQSSDQKIICLTVNLPVNESVFDDLVDFCKINIHEINEKYNFDSYTGERIKKYENLVKEIKKLEGDILIGNAAYNVEDFKVCNSLFAKNNLQIKTVFIRSEERRNADLNEGQQLYRDHNRWIDFYPGQIEDVHQKNEDNLKEIIDYFQGSDTILIGV